MVSAYKALVVEDDRHMCNLLAVLLREQGLDTVIATNAADARAELDSYPFDIALVDVGLDKENGLDVVRALRRHPSHVNREVPILVVSGQSQRAVIESARDAGADAYLIKPVSGLSLVAKISALREKRRPFIESASYCGPDRRRNKNKLYDGPERRRPRDEYLEL